MTRHEARALNAMAPALEAHFHQIDLEAERMAAADLPTPSEQENFSLARVNLSTEHPQGTLTVWIPQQMKVHLP